MGRRQNLERHFYTPQRISGGAGRAPSIIIVAESFHPCAGRVNMAERFRETREIFLCGSV